MLGVRIGKGPFVSDGDTLQLPESSSSLLQEAKTVGRATITPSPFSPPDKNFFLSILYVFLFGLMNVITVFLYLASTNLANFGLSYLLLKQNYYKY